jgi:hypothetical protein
MRRMNVLVVVARSPCCQIGGSPEEGGRGVGAGARREAEAAAAAAAATEPYARVRWEEVGSVSSFSWCL